MSVKIDNLEYWVQRTIPQVYDDSLSFQELLAKVLAKLNEVIDETNGYFNKDLKVFVGEILQGWYDDGTLATIINEEVFTDLNAQITAVDEKYKKHLQEMSINIAQPPYNVSPGGNASGVINQIIADAVGSVSIFIPKGEYYLTSPIILKEGVTILGAGMVYRETGGTILRTVGDIHGITTGLGEASTEDARSITLRDFLVVGDRSIPEANKLSYGLTGYHLRYNVVLNNVGFKRFKDGIHLYQSWTVDFYKVLTNYNDRYGVCFEGGANRVNLYGCEMNANGIGFYIPPVGINQGVLIQGCLIEGNRTQGMQINATQNVEINSNYFEGNAGAQLYLRGEAGFENFAVEVHSNRFYGISGNSSLRGLQIGDFTLNCVISANYFRRFDREGGSAIRMSPTSNTDFVIMPNRFSENLYDLEIVGQLSPTFVGKGIANKINV